MTPGNGGEGHWGKGQGYGADSGMRDGEGDTGEILNDSLTATLEIR